MFKKGLALALALIILTSMISCGNDAESVDGALTKKQLAFIDSLGKTEDAKRIVACGWDSQNKITYIVVEKSNPEESGSTEFTNDDITQYYICKTDAYYNANRANAKEGSYSDAQRWFITNILDCPLRGGGEYDSLIQKLEEEGFTIIR
ncbi:MAG: hypothetical protein ACLVML_08405 [Candidatus Gastranaerophilaceae bacterium]|nr:hypothetical protein [Christensenellales bacterium]